MKVIQTMMNMNCLFKHMMQTRTNWYNKKEKPHKKRKKEPQWREKKNQKHHCNRHLKKRRFEKLR